MSIIYEIVERVSKGSGLSIYGVDVIVETGTRKHYIIDINYFPGFEGTDRVPEKLLALTKETLKKSEEQLLSRRGDSQFHHRATA